MKKEYKNNTYTGAGGCGIIFLLRDNYTHSLLTGIVFLDCPGCRRGFSICVYALFLFQAKRIQNIKWGTNYTRFYI